MPETRPNNIRPVLPALTASAGMVLFAVCSHRGLPWILVGVAGLLLTTAAIAPALRSTAQSLALIGLAKFSRRTVVFAAVGCAVGAGFGMGHRHSLGLPLLPAGGVELFGVVACLIGATEELVFRGWLQGSLRARGWPVAVVAAALAHAAYKAGLFAWPTAPNTPDCLALGLWTAAAGIIPGLLREFSGSVVPAMAAHVAFDFVVYGAVAHAPWWVWT